MFVKSAKIHGAADQIFKVTEPVLFSFHPSLTRLEQGQVVDLRWLKAQGITRAMVRNYERLGFLEQLAPRLYRRPLAQGSGELTRWHESLASAHFISLGSFYIGGVTALEMLGQKKRIGGAKKSKIDVYDPTHSAPPWLFDLPVDASYVIHRRKLFRDQTVGLEWRCYDPITGEVSASRPPPKSIDFDKRLIRIATLERAAVEVINAVPDRLSFEEADEIFSELEGLEPSAVSLLLQTCCSDHAKRLFLFYVDRHQPCWSKSLPRLGIDLGHGPRVLAPRGKMDPRYKITVPAPLLKPLHGTNLLAFFQLFVSTFAEVL